MVQQYHLTYLYEGVPASIMHTQWRSQAGAHWGTCPSNYWRCPTSAGTVCNRIIGTDSIAVDHKSGTTLTVREFAASDLYFTAI